MFKKQPIKVQRRHLLSGSDRKKLRAAVAAAFPSLQLQQQDALDQLLPPKADIAEVKLAQSRTVLYEVAGEPLLVELDEPQQQQPASSSSPAARNFWPTVYALWLLPDLLPSIDIQPPVLRPLLSGADLMLPGVVAAADADRSSTAAGAPFRPGVVRGAKTAVRLRGTRTAVAVGTMLLDADHVRAHGMRGKALAVVHCLHDHLWQAGSRRLPPQLPVASDADSDSDSEEADPGAGAAADSSDDAETAAAAAAGRGLESTAPAAGCDDESAAASHGGVTVLMAPPEQQLPFAGAAVAAPETAAGAVDEDAQQQQQQTVEEEDRPPGSSGTPADAAAAAVDAAAVDAGWGRVEPQDQPPEWLLNYCFLFALRKVKDRQLPMLVNELFAAHVLPARPEGTEVDVKKTRYKKLSAFLAELQLAGLIVIDSTAPGVFRLTRVNRSHPSYVAFRPLPKSATSIGSDGDSASRRDASSEPLITELYRPGERLLRLLVPPEVSDAGQQQLYQQQQQQRRQESPPAAGMFTAGQLRDGLMAYIAQHDLSCQTDKSAAVLDEALLLLAPTKRPGDVLPRKTLIDQLLSKAQPFYQLCRDGNCELRKGAVPHVQITVEKRQGNKSATLIANLENFGVSVETVAPELAKAFASSTTVHEGAAKGSGKILFVQGNFLKAAQDYFMETPFSIPRKYFSGKDKTSR